jgi:hypothetical protein
MHSISQIDLAVKAGRAEGYRICNTPDPGEPLAQFWGVDRKGLQRFGTSRTLLTMVVFPSEKLAKRCLEMTGGHVVTVASILAAQRKKMELQMKKLQSMKGLK